VTLNTAQESSLSYHRANITAIRNAKCAGLVRHTMNMSERFIPVTNTPLPYPPPPKPPRPSVSQYVLMCTTSSAWPLQMVPQHSWIGNTVEVYDCWTRAKDAMNRRETDAGLGGFATRRVTATYSVDGGYEDWNSNSTAGLVEAFNGEWNLWWIREVAFGG
jgi:hypothetical protein